jgi:hypothetical protein
MKRISIIFSKYDKEEDTNLVIHQIEFSLMKVDDILEKKLIKEHVNYAFENFDEIDNVTISEHPIIFLKGSYINGKTFE